MFCFKCGNKVNEDAAFCANCGAKIPENPECKIQTQSLSKVKFPLFIDDIPIDELSNGQKETYRIKPGEHCIQIGFKGDASVRIWIRATEDTSPIYLNYIWGVYNKRDIVCLQPQAVTKPSQRGKVSFNVLFGIACAVLGVAGFFLAGFVMPQHSGTMVSAEAHASAIAVMSSVTRLFIGGIVLVVIGELILFLPVLRTKKKFQKEIQNRKSKLSRRKDI